MKEYPRPCNNCTNENCGNPKNPDHYMHCKEWLTWFRWWWKRFNAHGKGKIQKREVFVYKHPDETRKGLKESPCKGCQCEETCDTACERYISWYDSRMAMIRQRYGNGH